MIIWRAFLLVTFCVTGAVRVDQRGDIVPDEGRGLQISSQSSIVQDASAAVQTHLKELCPSEDPSLTEVVKVHWAKSKVVHGISVKLILELRSGAKHLMTVNFDEQGSASEWVRPEPSEGHVCNILLQSTMDEGAIAEVLSHFEPSDDDDDEMRSKVGYSGGHLSEFDEKVPLASLAELQSWDVHKLPPAYDVRSDHGNSRVCFPDLHTGVKEQGTCGSCWAFAALGALGDRHCLANPHAMTTPDLQRRVISTQQVLSCTQRDGCDGGHAWLAWDPFKEGARLTFEDEYPYQVRCFRDIDGVTQSWGPNSQGIQKFFDCLEYAFMKDDDSYKPCGCVHRSRQFDTQPTCREDKSTAGELAVHSYARIRAHSAEEVPAAVAAIQSAIFADGPVYAAIDVYRDWIKFIRAAGGEKVYRHLSEDKREGRHAMVMVGWGSLECEQLPSGEKDVFCGDYWTLRNSWGVDFGDQGHYKHVRGINDCDIEGAVFVPRIKPSTKKHNMQIASATIDNRHLPQGPFGVVGIGRRRALWELHITCSAPCYPLFAIIPKVHADKAKDAASRAKCCCDSEAAQAPAHCILTPFNDLVHRNAVNGMFAWHDRICGKYDFGNGLSQSVEKSDAKSCGAPPDCGSDCEELTVKSTGKDSFKVEVDLAERPHLSGDHELLVKARLSLFHDVDDEETFKVSIET